MDLIGGYLLVVMALFVANIALMLGNYKLSNLKVIVFSLICSAITFAIMNVSSLLNGQLSFLSDYFSYLFLAITIIIFVSIVYYIRRDDFKIPFYSISLAFVISTALLSSQANLDFLSMALYSLLVFIICWRHVVIILWNIWFMPLPHLSMGVTRRCLSVQKIKWITL